LQLLKAKSKLLYVEICSSENYSNACKWSRTAIGGLIDDIIKREWLLRSDLIQSHWWRCIAFKYHLINCKN